MTQAKTTTVPEHERRGFTEASPVIGLRVLGSNHEVLLGPKPKLTVGTEPGCDVVLALPYVSRIHCVIERDGDRLILRDRSKNGTVFVGLAGERRSEGELADGTVVILGTTPLIAFSARQRRLREALQWHLGWADRHQQGVDQALALGVSDRHVLIVAPEGSEPEALARVIHSHSPTSSRPFVVAPGPKHWRSRRAQREAIDRAAWGVMHLPVESLPEDPGFLLAALGSASFHVRVVAAATTREAAVERLGLDLYTRMQAIDVPPLLARQDDLLRLADDIIQQAAGAWGGTPTLTQADRVTLTAYTWPGNTAELRRILGHLAALAREGSLRQASRALGITRQTLENRLDRIGLDRTAPRAWVPAAED